MFQRLGKLVTQHRLLIIFFWIALCVGLRFAAPRWDDITHDGDLAYLPAAMPSVVGQRMLAEAFPNNRAKSQIVMIVARDDQKLDQNDVVVAYDLARRFLNLSGAARLARAQSLKAQLKSQDEPGEADSIQSSASNALLAAYEREVEAAAEALDGAIYFDQNVARHAARVADRAAQASDDADQPSSQAEATPSVAKYRPPRLVAAYHNRALLADLQGRNEAAHEDRQRVEAWAPRSEWPRESVMPADAATLPIQDVWTWQDRLVGEKLISGDRKARLLVIHLTNEFMATDNVRVLKRVEREVAEVRENLAQSTRAGLEIGVSGSAAVGGDMLRSAAASIRNTELCTVVLVVLILFLIYRSPLLIAVPLVSITLALLVATSLVALLTQLGQLPGFSWWELKIFTTTKIFVVVILFGAGTDYCLFLISRYREELERNDNTHVAMERALSGVGDALAASALTTILGLSTMYFADFGKFRYSGPVIGLSLAVTLLVCISLTPALLTALGRVVFWPGRIARRPGRAADANGLASGASNDHSGKQQSTTGRWSEWLWSGLARQIVARPGLILVVSVGIMLPLAWHGFRHFTPAPKLIGESQVTYDFLSSLADDRPSKRGAELLRRHFPVGEAGPVTVLMHRPSWDFLNPEISVHLRNLTDELYLPGVRSVRCLVDPLGDYEPGEKPGFLSQRGKRYRLLRSHPRTKAAFVTQVPELAGSVTRLEVVMDADPFSPDAIACLHRVDAKLRGMTRDPESAWRNARFAYAGTTAGIRDLRAVTQSDNLRIEILVVLAVLAVLLVILRRPLVSLYMVASVLFSFYVTIGATALFFQWAYGSQYAGLDWKVPLFLFVILVAVGQDYNVYLATRVFEEQAQHGVFGGLRRAVVQTGSIITSCGLIMAGTFLSMTSGTWSRVLGEWLPFTNQLAPPSAGGLRGIVEMGFALSLGVLLDTFVVRTVLVPAFFALLGRAQLNRQEMLKNKAFTARKTGNLAGLEE